MLQEDNFISKQIQCWLRQKLDMGAYSSMLREAIPASHLFCIITSNYPSETQLETHKHSGKYLSCGMKQKAEVITAQFTEKRMQQKYAPVYTLCSMYVWVCVLRHRSNI